MREALKMADEAERLGEVPVGAVLVGPEGELARGFNQPHRQSTIRPRTRKSTCCGEAGARNSATTD